MKKHTIFLVIFFLSLGFIQTAYADSIIFVTGEGVQGEIVLQTEIFLRMKPTGEEVVKEYLLEKIATIEDDGAITILRDVQAAPPPKEQQATEMKSEAEPQTVSPVVEVIGREENPSTTMLGEKRSQLFNETVTSPAPKSETPPEWITIDNSKKAPETAALPPKTKKDAMMSWLFYENLKLTMGVVIGLIILALTIILAKKKDPTKGKDGDVSSSPSSAPPGPFPRSADRFPSGRTYSAVHPSYAETIRGAMKGETATDTPSEMGTSATPIKPLYPQPLPQKDVVPTIDVHEKNYWQHLPRVFIYPVRGKILWATLGATVFFSIMNVAMFAPFYGFIVMIIFFCYSIACMVSIIETAATSDREDYFEWPDYQDWFDWIGKGILLVLANILCFAMAGAYFWFFKKIDILFFILVFFGGFIQPMYVMAIALVGGFSSLNIINVVKSVSYTLVPYTITLIFLILVQCLNFLIQMIPLLQIPIWGFLLKWFLFVYFMFVNMRTLGLFYRAHRLKLRWYGEDEHDV